MASNRRRAIGTPVLGGWITDAVWWPRGIPVAPRGGPASSPGASEPVDHWRETVAAGASARAPAVRRCAPAVRQRRPTGQRLDGGGPVGGEQHRQRFDRARHQQHAGGTPLHAPPGAGEPVERFAIAQERPSRPCLRRQPAQLKAVGERRGSDHQSSAIVQGMEVATGLNLSPGDPGQQARQGGGVRFGGGSGLAAGGVRNGHDHPSSDLELLFIILFNSLIKAKPLAKTSGFPVRFA